MTDNPESIATRLKAPFRSDQTKWKVQSLSKDKSKGMLVPYSDARHIMDRLDDVVGIANWYDAYVPIGDKGVICILYLRLDGEWIGKSDGAPFTQIESTKGGITDSFKRAASRWGIGRYYYSIPPVWSELDEYKRSKLTSAEIWAKAFQGKAIPAQFLPEDDPLRSRKTNPKAPPRTNIKKEAAPQESAPKEELATIPESTLKAATIKQALDHIIPKNIGVPMAGKTLGEALTEPGLGRSIIVFLAGEARNMAGALFEPGENDELRRLHEAAVTIYNNEESIRGIWSKTRNSVKTK